jgi:hypothetical protein
VSAAGRGTSRRTDSCEVYQTACRSSLAIATPWVRHRRAKFRVGKLKLEKHREESILEYRKPQARGRADIFQRDLRRESSEGEGESFSQPSVAILLTLDAFRMDFSTRRPSAQQRRSSGGYCCGKHPCATLLVLGTSSPSCNPPG